MEMKRRALCLLLILAQILAMAGCAAAPTASGGTLCARRPTVRTHTPLPHRLPEWTAPEAPPAPDVRFDESGLAPWQRAYMAFLRELCARETPLRMEAGCTKASDTPAELSKSYTLYDVDKDGVPELFIRFGDCEAAFYTVAYAFREGAVAEIGLFGASHSALYTWPGENALIQSWGHMGSGGMDKYIIADGQLVFLENFFYENINGTEARGYTDPSVLVPGASYLNECDTMLTMPEWAPLTLPIYDYGRAPDPLPPGSEADAAARAAILAVLKDGGLLYGVSGDGFGGDTGWKIFSDYCAPGTVIKYADHPMTLKALTWLDFNGDGRTECLLLLNASHEDDDWLNPQYILLNHQDGVVYAYCLNYSTGYLPDQNGVFYDGEWDATFALSFWKNQCYIRYNVPRDPSAAPAVWERVP